jgi:hypothetical protein
MMGKIPFSFLIHFGKRIFDPIVGDAAGTQVDKGLEAVKLAANHFSQPTY